MAIRVPLLRTPSSADSVASRNLRVVGDTNDVSTDARISIDVGVVEAARGGDEDALRRLVTQAYPLVRRWTVVHGADSAELEDATQEVMLNVLRRLPSFRGESLFTTWLYRITRNVWIDRRKAASRRDRRVSELAPELGSAAEKVAANARSPSENPGRALELADLRACIERAFDELSARQREVFDLADVQGFTSTEIGEMLGLEPSSVRVTLLNARRALRTRLLRMDPDLAREFGDEL